MPFGLCNAPATFQRVMALVLRGLPWEQVLAYLDDVISLGRGFDEALENIISVLKRFRLHKLKLKARMCAFFQREVLFLGRMVSCEGMAANPSSISRGLN